MSAINRMVSTRAPHLARWKYADDAGRIVYRDAAEPESDKLRLIRPPEVEGSPEKPAATRTVKLESQKEVT
jgi:hypothetical protein